ncbi:hypothetical protein C6Y56_21690 [Pseudomonas fluorescens]|uniref:Uncharacterized protein n=1 Tax=Pseudomonas fluorescens TaxID=294 RepID=A0A7Z3CAT9_PSEFL|nr:hypothetical protein C6Y56_21690 [Pseudomonas fluorescens]
MHSQKNNRAATAYTEISVGAGLLAKADCQSTFSLSDPPLSRASPLPHLILPGIKIGVSA